MRNFKIHCSQIGKIMGASKPIGGLSVTCKSFLHEWYADEMEEIHSKYTDKGNQVEPELINFMAEILELGLAEKNEQIFEDDYFIGTPDVVASDFVVDVKAPFNKKTFNEKCILFDEDYKSQGQGYMHLTGKSRFIIFYGLMDTPEEANYGREVIYSDMLDSARWVGYEFKLDEAFIESVVEKVKLCRDYLSKYDTLVKSKLGKIHPN